MMLPEEEEKLVKEIIEAEDEPTKTKAGEVIAKIVKFVKDLRTGKHDWIGARVFMIAAELKSLKVLIVEVLRELKERKDK